MEPTPSPRLEQALRGLRNALVPVGFADTVMHRVRSERRWMGLHPREWAFIGVSFGAFTVAVQVLVAYVTAAVSG